MNLLRKCLLKAAGAVLNDRSSKAVFYHDFFTGRPVTGMATPLSLFREHLDMAGYLGFRAVTSINDTGRQMQVCLDDGFAGVWECREFFHGLDWWPTVFLAVELIGRPDYLSREQILELQRDGFRFQSHGWSHRPLTEVPLEELAHETADSKSRLEDLLGTEVSELCFPVGMFSPKVLDACRDAGYRRMYSSIPGNFSKEIFPGVVRRNLVQFYSPNEFRSALLGGLSPFAGRYFRMHYHP